MPMLPGKPQPFDAIARRDTEMIALSRQRFSQPLRFSATLAVRWMTSIAPRLDHDRRRLVVIMSKPLIAQLAYLLLDVLAFGPLGASFELGVLDLLGRLLRRSRRRRQAGQCAAVAGLAPLGQVRGVPSRRSSTPRAAGSAASYSASMSSLYWVGNDRLRGRSERGLIAPFSVHVLGRSAAVRVNVIKPVLALCGREKVLPEVSQLSLKHRARATMLLDR
jgi:CRP-like cAMP-binding protein